ncbi:MAG: DUF4846 domain-containing protein [Gammaproteobacteria bacterium]
MGKITLTCFLVFYIASLSAGEYPWLETADPDNALAARIAAPFGYRRVPAAAGSFQDWLRHLPLKPGKPDVYLYNGQPKRSQNVHAAVVDIDVGERDLQQCADAVLRLRAEYLYATEHYKVIRFNFTSGDNFAFSRWSQGYRPQLSGRRIAWQKGKAPGVSHASLRKYLDTLFIYAGSASLAKELQPVKDIADLQIGDVFIQGGFPGHAVLVVDMAQNSITGKKVFLLAQSYMPAQDIHILRNPESRLNSPWYDSGFGETLRTPEWAFTKHDLKRFR